VPRRRAEQHRSAAEVVLRRSWPSARQRTVHSAPSRLLLVAAAAAVGRGPCSGAGGAGGVVFASSGAIGLGVAGHSATGSVTAANGALGISIGAAGYGEGMVDLVFY
jgi:hypothetical protein